jgi:hypothetical protein
MKVCIVVDSYTIPTKEAWLISSSSDNGELIVKSFGRALNIRRALFEKVRTAEPQG